MMKKRDLSVKTSSGQNQVIGKRHFGQKAKAPGGDGEANSNSTRELFNPVLLWLPKLKVNEQGVAQATLKLNDSLTSFRVVAIAHAGENMFGTGQTTIESTKELIIYAGNSPVMRQGDKIKSVYTLRNTSEQNLLLKVTAKAEELPDLNYSSEISLNAHSAKTAEVAFTVPEGIKEINLQFSAMDKNISDSIISKIKINPAVMVRVQNSTLAQIDKTLNIPVQIPQGALTDRGGLKIQGAKSLATGLSGIKLYMEDYPYSCLEQKVSRAVSLNDWPALSEIIQGLPAYMDKFGLLKFFPSSQCGDPLLSRYVLSILTEGNLSIPDQTKQKILGALKNHLLGKERCQEWWDSFYKNTFAQEEVVLILEVISRFGAIDEGLLSSIKITPNLWQNETLAAWIKILLRRTEIKDRDNLLKHAQSIFRARVNYQGSLMTLQNVKGDNWEAKWRLFTSNDQEALEYFSVALLDPSWKNDVPKMARSLITRMRQGHYDTSMSNAWAITHMNKFAAQFEKDDVTGNTEINLSSAVENKKLLSWATANPSEILEWPKTKESSLAITHNGNGKPWLNVAVLAAIPLKKPIDFGYTIKKKITPIYQQKKGSWQVGDVANVEITINSKTDQTWAVVQDPIPAGATHLGTGLDGSSRMLNRTPPQKTKSTQEFPLEYEEKSLSNYTAYAAFLPKGAYTVNYRIRLNSAGVFKLPTTRVEAMYAPEMFGEFPNADWIVAP